ncbi:hypothetical protein K432DRAFT_359289 [Lepidopterella palustris CBS 459.81]|uniref:Uncharacterized protein n=1 Tax=Lepidopterella palustris CBS 459.81 TaxID=1314670 RepID=A0A8E2E4C6_9PEZI|nr:hypothetical protein K432DRAFT_359289 [Lepidopterella palustris CBS 459.81]
MVTITSPVATGTLQAIAGTSGGFPVAQYSAQATLDKCPSDYQSIGNVCCPSNYVPWSAAFGGQTPCYSTLPIALTPPPIPDNITGTATDYTVSNIPTSAIVNVVYAMQYPVKPASPGLAPTAKIGIGAGVGGAALLFGILISLLIWKHHTNKRDRAALESPSNFEPDMSLARQGTNLAMSRYSAPSGIGAGIIHDWRQRVPYGEQLGQQVLPQVGPRRYPVDWTPGAASTSPPTNRYVRDSGLRYPSPPTPEMYPSQPELQGRLSPSARTGVTYGYPANATELHADRAL